MRRWYIWWVSRVQWVNQRWVDNGSWYDPQYLTDNEAFHLALEIEKSTTGSKLYRMVWTGSEWRYDTRLLA